ncbi:hypothetical protein MYSTI_03441 [Myxococcus stipitatus DSM 14675]|uniref:Uncharacterized protein n=1 Tax=Myxococcus stipitatus (strain DSM 14675 / JCM 12634 / Mx s8) TaxID=1278073 RepID=L7U9L2_MYXSD|nr:hypothetical protein [Myxococcus stipitatus]AGC44753.1 hypothetical protein MYSTI_03441 [Myxococcus stipitatus DSM 14675]
MATQQPPAARPEEPAPERRAGGSVPPRLPPKEDEAREDGIPGYGQPDPEVREKSLPEQGW